MKRAELIRIGCLSLAILAAYALPQDGWGTADQDVAKDPLLLRAVFLPVPAVPQTGFDTSAETGNRGDAGKQPVPYDL